MLERAECLMPEDMAVQNAGTVVGWNPAGDQRVGIRNRAVLEHRVQQRMRRVCVGPAHVETALRHGAAAFDVAVLGQRPAMVGEKPPVVAIVMRMAPAQIDAGLVVIGHAGKSEQPERTQRQRHHDRVARMRFEML